MTSVFKSLNANIKKIISDIYRRIVSVPLWSLGPILVFSVVKMQNKLLHLVYN